ncbi:MAG: hypothetical protein AB1768_19740 [Pseudomonadota bacterium]
MEIEPGKGLDQRREIDRWRKLLEDEFGVKGPAVKPCEAAQQPHSGGGIDDAAGRCGVCRMRSLHTNFLLYRS